MYYDKKKKKIKKHLPNDTSIFSAQACAVDMALNLIQKFKKKKKEKKKKKKKKKIEDSLFFSDLLSVLTSLQSKKLNNPLIKLLCKLEKNVRR